MRVRFLRLPDGEKAYSIVERDDGVRYRLHQGVAGPQLPHDLVHLLVERATGEQGGFWGAVAAGAVFASMEHLDGRRPPHARDRSTTAIRARGEQLMRAELMAGLVEYVAHHQLISPKHIRAAARQALATLPDPTVDEHLVLHAARVLRDNEQRWAALHPGEELVADWPVPSSKSNGHRRQARGSSR